MNETKKAWLARILAGGLCGWAVLLLIGYIAGSFSLWGPSSFRGFVFVDATMERLLGSRALAVAVQFALFFLFGAGAGVATLPFADGGKELLLRSALHFLYMEGLTGLGVWLNFAGHESPLPWMGVLALVYASVWLGRYAAWWGELDAIRDRLGLAPAPSPLRWRESLPSLVFALLLCLVLPLVLKPFDAIDGPLLTGALWPWLLVPAGGFMGGLSLGRRKGFCPLYPAACTVLAVLATLLLDHGGAAVNGAAALAASLGGDLAGAAWRGGKRKEGARP